MIMPPRFQELVNRKAQIKAELVALFAKEQLLKLECHEILPRAVFLEKKRAFVAIEQERAKLIAEQANVRAELGRVIAESDAARNASRAEKPEENTGSIRHKLVAVRSKWEAFASDQTRVSTMRLMANQFLDDLRPIIREMFNDKD